MSLALPTCLDFSSMLRLRLVAGARHPPLARFPSSIYVRTLYQTHTLTAAYAANAQRRRPSSHNQPTMKNPRSSPPSPTRSQPTGSLYSERAVLAKYPTQGLDSKLLKVPKEQLSLYTRKLAGTPAKYECEVVSYDRKDYWR